MFGTVVNTAVMSGMKFGDLLFTESNSSSSKGSTQHHHPSSLVSYLRHNSTHQEVFSWRDLIEVHSSAVMIVASYSPCSLVMKRTYP